MRAGRVHRLCWTDIMSKPEVRCVLLANPHHAMSEGIRGLVGTIFEAVVMVADEVSLFEGAAHLQSELAIVDTSLSSGSIVALVGRLHASFPAMKLLVLGYYDQSPLIPHLIDAGANGFVLKQAIATDLLPALDEILAGGQFVSRKAVVPDAKLVS